MKDKDQSRIVIKRPRKGGEAGFHGAWKIALADFMTTLMALFLVLWVISTATPQQLQGIANYFSTPLSKAIAGGPKNSASDSAIPGGGPDPVYAKGERASMHIRAEPKPESHRGRLRQLRKRIAMAIQADKQLRDIRKQLRLEMTPQGLRIQMVDSDRRPMFELGSATPEPYMSHLLDILAPLLNALPNDIIINGYTDARQYHNGIDGYSNWDLSAARANASRRELLSAGFDSSKLLAVSGMADRVPLAGTTGLNPANRRIEILVLTPKAAQGIKNTGILPK